MQGIIEVLEASIHFNSIRNEHMEHNSIFFGWNSIKLIHFVVYKYNSTINSAIFVNYQHRIDSADDKQNVNRNQSQTLTTFVITSGDYQKIQISKYLNK